ncbi:MAG: DUF4145 domain-containing protein [Candidatus Woesearchaeota archaeon]|nr:DUF4145 domain-containing protein [Candidatus Woesearchaeota archaeon]
MMHQVLVDIQQALKEIQDVPKGNILDYKKQRQEGTRLKLKGAILQLLEETKNTDAYHLAQKLSVAKPEGMSVILEKLADFAVDEEKKTSWRMPRLPSEVKDEILADLSEIQTCMKAGCFRSAVILCGRIMETALHRKYYDATGQDLLEKAPGTGLGNLIAKLAEKGVKLDPGLPNQIHLINQVRVFSVHTKKEPFSPSKTQAEAIVLYTMDVLDKLFK